jgi:hypothetical protein
MGPIAAGPQLRQQAFDRYRERSLHSATAGALVTAPAEGRGDSGHVHRSLAAQTYAETAIGLLAEK